MTYNNKITKYWIPVICWMVFIFWMSTETFSSQNTSFLVDPILRYLFPKILPQQAALIHAFIRKAGHVIEYFILSILLFRAFRGDSSQSWNWRWASLAVIMVIFYAAGDEFHQSFVPSQEASVKDVATDTAGGILAQLMSALWHHYRKE
jgi:VanZ family protein